MVQQRLSPRPATDDGEDFFAPALTSVASRGGELYSAWREFALRKDVLNVATGLMIGNALTSITNSLVTDVLSPLIMLAWSGTDDIEGAFLVLKRGSGNATAYATVEEAALDGAITLNYGRFLDSVLDFLIISFLVFLLFRCIRGLSKRADAAVKQKL